MSERTFTKTMNNVLAMYSIIQYIVSKVSVLSYEVLGIVAQRALFCYALVVATAVVAAFVASAVVAAFVATTVVLNCICCCS